MKNNTLYINFKVTLRSSFSYFDIFISGVSTNTIGAHAQNNVNFGLGKQLQLSVSILRVNWGNAHPASSRSETEAPLYVVSLIKTEQRVGTHVVEVVFHQPVVGG